MDFSGDGKLQLHSVVYPGLCSDIRQTTKARLIFTASCHPKQPPIARFSVTWLLKLKASFSDRKHSVCQSILFPIAPHMHSEGQGPKHNTYQSGPVIHYPRTGCCFNYIGVTTINWHLFCCLTWSLPSNQIELTDNAVLPSKWNWPMLNSRLQKLPSLNGQRLGRVNKVKHCTAHILSIVAADHQLYRRQGHRELHFAR